MVRAQTDLDHERRENAWRNQTDVAAPAVRMNNGVQGHTTANYGLKCAFSAVRHHFRVNAAVALEDAKDDRLARGATAPFASDSTRPEVAFIDFNFAVRVRRSALALGGNALSHFEKDHGDCLARQSGQLRNPSRSSARFAEICVPKFSSACNSGLLISFQ